MRLWSIHPSFLDRQGLLGLWREGLLAQKVLLGKTKGYRNHPQLIRFKNTSNPILYIGTYLYFVYLEGKIRKYNFDKNKIISYSNDLEKLELTKGQLIYEYNLILYKLKTRDKKKYEEILNKKPIPNPIFRLIEGNIESWEKVKPINLA